MRRLIGLILLTVLAVLAGHAGLCAELPGVEEIIEKGDLFLEDDKVGDAIEAYRQAIKREAGSAEAHQKLGRALSMVGDLEGALYEATKATQLDAESAPAHATRGRILGMMHRYRESAAEEFTSLRIDPDNAPAYLTLGLALASLGDYDDAVGAIYEAVRLEPDNLSAYVNLGAVLGRKGDFKSAVAVYKRALELNPNSVSTRLGLGAALGKTGDMDGQIREFRAAVDLAPNSDSAHGKLGWALYRHGDLEGALKEGCITNWLRLKRFGPQYLKMFTYIWAGVFLLFGAIFSVIFIGSKLTPQADEIIIKSYFLAFFKDRPGRFVITNKRVVWIPERFSKWFGARDLSIDRNDIREIDSTAGVNNGRLKFVLRDGTSHDFTMPLFVFRPLKAQLDKLGERARLKLTGHWVIPKEVQDAIDAGVGLPEPSAPKTDVTAALIESAARAAEVADSIEVQADTRAKWKTLRRPTKVYAFVDGKFVEAEAGDQEEESESVEATSDVSEGPSDKVLPAKGDVPSEAPAQANKSESGPAGSGKPEPSAKDSKASAKEETSTTGPAAPNDKKATIGTKEPSGAAKKEKPGPERPESRKDSQPRPSGGGADESPSPKEPKQ